MNHAEQVDQYCRDVVSGTISACKWVRLACKRHLDDMVRAETDLEYPYYYDPDALNKFCNFAELMVFVEGKEFAGKPVKLEPWQKFTFGIPFGWKKRSDGYRRFSEAIRVIPRKNAKSTCAAIEALYMLSADREIGAQCFCGATGKTQAMMVFRIAKLMVDRNPKFANAFGIKTTKESIFCNQTSSFIKTLIGKPGDGSNPQYASCDEYHEHPTSDLFDTMQTGMGSRTQPLLSVITTAGFNISGPCYAKQKELEKILEGTIDDCDHIFGVIYTIDATDDWTDYSVWKKANPNFGVSVYEDYLKKQYQTAMRDAAQQNKMKTKHLNVWSNASVSWINMPRWWDCEREVKLEDFRGCDCWVGIDLASKIDLTCMVVAVRKEGEVYLFGKHYLPEETILLPENSHYRRWVAEGYLTQTEGARTDYKVLMRDLFGQDIKKILRERTEWAGYFDTEVEGIMDICNVREIAYDPHEAELLMQDIRTFVGDEKCLEFTQSPAFISEPMKEFEALYLSGHLLHGKDPILDWCASNVVKRASKNKSYYPSKDKNSNKIDAIVASIMALARAMRSEGDDPWMMFM